VEAMPGVLLLSGIAAFVLALCNLRRSFSLAGVLRPRESGRPAARPDLPAACILAPCRGIDHRFETHVRALLAQQYPCYAVHFIVESVADPAWHVLSRILADTPAAQASLIIAGPTEGCSQKIHNLLAGLAQVGPNIDALAFVDSDAEVHPQWLRALVAPLSDRSIGATSGYRWYIPAGSNGAASLRSAWNAATLGLMTHPWYGFAWGGSMAIRRELFEQLNIAGSWARGLSDDLLLTQAVRAAGLQVRFVPEALVPTREPCTWRQLIEWTNRQVTIGRVYVPQAWSASLLVHLTSLTLSGLGLAASASGQWLASALLLSYWLSNGLGSLAVCGTALQRLAAQGFDIPQRAWPQALWAPAVTVLALLNIAVSLTTRTITWRGISYTMRSPRHIVVHRDAPVPAPSSQTASTPSPSGRGLG
jgi:ceramide glucosyltransferase